MNDELKYPSSEAAASVLKKIGVNPETRDLDCQDVEYTSCSLEELPRYYSLYFEESTTDKEKRVLGCFILQCLNDHLVENDTPHPLQKKSVLALYHDKRIHSSELDYWTDHPWSIAKYLEKSEWQN